MVKPFLKWLICFTLPSAMYESSLTTCSHPIGQLPGHSSRCVVVFSTNRCYLLLLVCSHLKASVIEQLFRCLPATHSHNMPFVRELVQNFHSFLIWLCIIIEWEEFFAYSRYKSFISYVLCDYFYPSLWLDFSFSYILMSKSL